MLDVPRCQYVKDTVEIDSDGSVVEWIGTAVPPVGRIDHAADPVLNVGGGERRGAEGIAGGFCGWNFAHGLCSDVAKVGDAGLEGTLAWV